MFKKKKKVLSIKDQIVENQNIIDELNQELKKKNEEVRIIQEISSEINSTLELDKILEIILNSMRDVLEFKHSMILLIDEENPELLTVNAAIGYDENIIGDTVRVGEGYIGVVAKRKQIFRIGNIRSNLSYASAIVDNINKAQSDQKPLELKKLPGLKGIESQIGIPLITNDKLIGVFAVESRTPNAFNELDEILLNILANQTASAIDNARFYKIEKENVAKLNRANTDLSLLKQNLEKEVIERTNKLSSALEEAKREKKRSEMLLKNVAPQELIPQLLKGTIPARKLYATIMFADLEGFTRLSSDMEPDELFSQLNHFLEKIEYQIEKYHGYINKTMGDGIMALFGIPTEKKTHVLEAVLAALAIQKEMKNLFNLNLRIGINTGTITAGMLGSETKSTFDVIGDTVNIASRMESIGSSCDITVCENTFKRVKRYFEFEDLGECEIKGKGNLRCYKVLNILPLQSDFNRIDKTSLFYTNYLSYIDKIQHYKHEHLKEIDILSVQSHDGAIYHNEAVAAFSTALLDLLKNSASLELDSIREDIKKIKEEDVILLSLLHDVGKYAVNHKELIDPILSQEKKISLSENIRKETVTVLTQMNLSRLTGSLNQLYQFESDQNRELDLLTAVVAVSDIYDALTSPKIHKGKPWSITGSLVELLRTPYYQRSKNPVFKYFILLMKGEKNNISLQTESKELFI